MNIEKKKLPSEISITWSPCEIYHTKDVMIGFNMALDILKNVQKVSDKFIFYPEVGLQGNNIHFHGIIELKDPVKWYKSVLPKLKRNGFVKIKPIFDKLMWLEYCKKDFDIMKYVFEIDEPIYKFINRRTDTKGSPLSDSTNESTIPSIVELMERYEKSMTKNMDELIL